MVIPITNKRHERVEYFFEIGYSSVSQMNHIKTLVEHFRHHNYLSNSPSLGTDGGPLWPLVSTGGPSLQVLHAAVCTS